jgi:putative lipoprotein
MKMRSFFALVLGLLLFVSPALAARVTLSGQVTYHERMALPGGATLQIQLIDQTLPSLPPRLDVKAPIGAGQVPISFNLGFEQSLILPGHTYALVATIAVPEGVLFRNTEPFVVDPLAPPQPLLIVTNRFASDTAHTAPATPQPGPPETTPAILDATWTAATIRGTPVLPRSRPTLSIGADMRAGGTTGCNTWFAQAELKGDTVRFGKAGATLMACLSDAVAHQEVAFNAALADAARWQVTGNTLTLFGVDGAALLTFTR